MKLSYAAGDTTQVAIAMAPEVKENLLAAAKRTRHLLEFAGTEKLDALAVDRADVLALTTFAETVLKVIP